MNMKLINLKNNPRNNMQKEHGIDNTNPLRAEEVSSVTVKDWTYWKQETNLGFCTW
jgi:hypothetical protein